MLCIINLKSSLFLMLSHRRFDFSNLQIDSESAEIQSRPLWTKVSWFDSFLARRSKCESDFSPVPLKSIRLFYLRQKIVWVAEQLMIQRCILGVLQTHGVKTYKNRSCTLGPKHSRSPLTDQQSSHGTWGFINFISHRVRVVESQRSWRGSWEIFNIKVKMSK